MSIWLKLPKLDTLNKICTNTIMEHLCIELTDYTDDELIGTMPVGPNTHQPFGVLHGGASCVLAETLGSMASNMCLDTEKQYAVGLEINANHVRPVKSGTIRGVAKNIHLGRKTHIWDIKIFTEDQKLVCVSRLTMAVIDK